MDCKNICMLNNNNISLNMDLKDRVRKSGLTQTNIAKRLGISKEHLNYMLNGKRDLKEEYREGILSLLKKVG